MPVDVSPSRALGQLFKGVIRETTYLDDVIEGGLHTIAEGRLRFIVGVFIDFVNQKFGPMTMVEWTSIYCTVDL